MSAPSVRADALRRGVACTGDVTCSDHLALVELPLSEVRERLGVTSLGA